MKNEVLIVRYTVEHPDIHILQESITNNIIEINSPDSNGPTKTFKGYICRISNMLKSLSLPVYSVYFISDPGSVILKKLIHPKIKVIQNVDSSYYSSLMSEIPKRNYTKIEKFLVKLIFPRIVDGVIANCEFYKNEVAKVLNCPIVISEPTMIHQNRYNTLYSLTPNLKNHNIVFIGNKRDIFKTDILIEAFKIVKEKYKDTELYIVGSGHSKSLEETKGIHIEGWRNNISDYLQNSSLSIVPAYPQGAYTGVAESLLGGIPTIISKYMGFVTTIESIDKRFVRDMTASDFAEGILWYFSLPLNEKKKYSEQAKEIGKQFTQKRKVKEYKKCFYDLLSTLQQREVKINK